MSNAIRHYIGRTITLTDCEGVTIRNGSVEAIAETLVGDYSPERATRKLRKALKDPNVTISKTDKKTNYYKMDVLEFVRRAERL